MEGETSLVDAPNPTLMNSETMFRHLCVGSELGCDGPEGDWVIIMPVPEDAPPGAGIASSYSPRGYRLSKSWPYKDSAGRLLGYAVRFEAEDGIPDNQLQMVTFWQHPDGRREWRVAAFPTPRPLYGLERLAQFPNAPVLVVEGEEAADAAQDIFPDHVVITSSGGSYGASPADWLPLVSREITIWRDASQAGLAYERDVADILVNIGAASVRAVDVPGYFTVGWSLADECPPGVTSTHLRELLVAASEAIGWSTPRPIKISLPQVEPLLPEMLPEAVRAYVFDVAHRLQVSPDYVAVTAICSLAAALGNGVRLAPKQNDDWQVVPISGHDHRPPERVENSSHEGCASTPQQIGDRKAGPLACRMPTRQGRRKIRRAERQGAEEEREQGD